MIWLVGQRTGLGNHGLHLCVPVSDEDKKPVVKHPRKTKPKDCKPDPTVTTNISEGSARGTSLSSPIAHGRSTPKRGRGQACGRDRPEDGDLGKRAPRNSQEEPQEDGRFVSKLRRECKEVPQQNLTSVQKQHLEGKCHNGSPDFFVTYENRSWSKFNKIEFTYREKRGLRTGHEGVVKKFLLPVASIIETKLFTLIPGNELPESTFTETFGVATKKEDEKLYFRDPGFDFESKESLMWAAERLCMPENLLSAFAYHLGLPPRHLRTATVDVSSEDQQTSTDPVTYHYIEDGRSIFEEPLPADQQPAPATKIPQIGAPPASPILPAEANSPELVEQKPAQVVSETLPVSESTEPFDFSLRTKMASSKPSATTTTASEEPHLLQTS